MYLRYALFTNVVFFVFSASNTICLILSHNGIVRQFHRRFNDARGLAQNQACQGYYVEVVFGCKASLSRVEKVALLDQRFLILIGISCWNDEITGIQQRIRLCRRHVGLMRAIGGFSMQNVQKNV